MNLIKMDYSALITQEAFLKLKCQFCKKYLSHFPIYISGDKQNVCGRCLKRLLVENSAQNEVYEALAQFVKFPCCYKRNGCAETLLPKDIPSHEKKCDFEKLKCPIHEFGNCLWTGPRSSVLYHCQDKHFDLFLKNNTFQLDLSLSHQCANILEYDSHLFIVRQKFYSINKLMELSICNLAFEVNVKESSCWLKFSTSKRSVTIECCTTAFANEQPVEIFLDSLSERNGSSLVTGKINLEKIDEEVGTIAAKVDEMLLTQLTCETCLEYALPPIYNQEGANFVTESPIRCNDCRNAKLAVKVQRETCNLNLDKIANLLNYPCKNKNNGCSFVAKPPQMSTHIEFCPLGKHQCPLSLDVKCDWLGMGKDVNAHILDAHLKMILTSDTVIEKLSCGERFGVVGVLVKFCNCYIIKFCDLLFRLYVTKSGDRYQWVVQMIGPFQEGFMFELEIVDTKKKRSGLMAIKPCRPLSSKFEAMENRSCYFNYDQIESFISDYKLTYKIRIHKRST